VADDKESKSKKSKKDEENKEEEKKTIMVDANDIQTLVLNSVSDLMDKGVLVETEGGKKIDLKDKVDTAKDKDDKKKTEKKRKDED
jgi:hypothetical protein